MNRRDFLRTSSGMLAASSLENIAVSALNSSIPTRKLGRTGETVTMLAFPGYHIGRMRDEKYAIHLVQRAVELGITFFDCAWAYEQGRSEERLGAGLAGRRDKVFVMTKTIARDRAGALSQLDESLRRLKMDHVDLWQFHAVSTQADAETIFGPGGAMEAARLAREKGKTRYIGFTGHRDPNVHAAVLRQYHGQLDTVQMPLNPLDPHFSSFENLALPEAVKHGVGVIAMKTVAAGAIVEEKLATAAECHRYAWSLPISVLVAGLESEDQLVDNVEQAKRFVPMKPGEKRALLGRTKLHAGGVLEAYKTDKPFSEWHMYPRQAEH